MESIKAPKIAVGDEFTRYDITWVVTRDDGASQLPDHAGRLVAEPKPA